jgi:TPR repeat protein
MLVFFATIASGADDPALVEACAGDDPAACAALGASRRDGGDPRGAVKAFASACKLGSREACVDEGIVLEALTPGSPKAMSMYQSACEAGVWRGCGERAATAYLAHDLDTALSWATRGCPSELPPTCAADPACNAGARRSCRVVYAVSDDLQRWDGAIASGTATCKLGDLDLCKVTAGTPHLSNAQHLELLRIGCDELSDASTCNEYGIQLSLGDLGVHDEPAGLARIERACELGSVDACLGRAETLASNPATAAQAGPYFAKACALGSKSACKRAPRAPPAQRPVLPTGRRRVPRARPGRPLRRGPCRTSRGWG